MVTKINRYFPDTCECVLEYSWDDSVPESERVHTPTTIVHKCNIHQSIQTTEEVFDTVVNKENRRKNVALGDILNNAPNNNWFDEDENGSRVLKNGITYNWEWSGISPNRVLTISFTGINITPPQRNALQNVLNNRFGNGTIVLA